MNNIYLTAFEKTWDLKRCPFVSFLKAGVAMVAKG
jgi:hypothetical protein